MIPPSDLHTLLINGIWGGDPGDAVCFFIVAMLGDGAQSAACRALLEARPAEAPWVATTVRQGTTLPPGLAQLATALRWTVLCAPPEVAIFVRPRPGELHFLALDAWRGLRRAATVRSGTGADVTEALAVEKLTPEALQGCRNCFVAAATPQGSTPFYAVRAAPDTAFQLGCYAGDAVTLRPALARPAQLSSVTAYLNPPPADEEEEAAAEAAAPAPGTIAAPGNLLADLGVAPGDTLHVRLHVDEDDLPPPAVEVVFSVSRPLEGGVPSAGSWAKLVCDAFLRPALGLAVEGKLAALRAAAARVATGGGGIGASESAPSRRRASSGGSGSDSSGFSMSDEEEGEEGEAGARRQQVAAVLAAALPGMEAAVASGECKHAPVVTGQTLPLPGLPAGAVVRVAATKPPFRAVIVGPETKVTVVPAGQQ